jgi:catechol 2,3-dioxygenase-like lactoylglutathione lyase family enzyme
VKLEPAGLTTKEDDMEAIVSNLVSRFENGLLSRRELVRGLAMLAGGGTAASAQEGLDFRAATIDHVSIQVADLKRSSEFYQMMFGFREVSDEPARNILRLGNTRTLVSLNLEKPTATVDHFAIGIPRYNKDAAIRLKNGNSALAVPAAQKIINMTPHATRRSQDAHLMASPALPGCRALVM